MISLLCVDDEPDLLFLTKEFLEGTGKFSVEGAESARRALEKLKNTQYDAIVSDYQMPDMDGIELLKAIRASGNTTPFLIFTGRGREEIVIKAYESGADFYIQKGGEPVSLFADLIQKIESAVSRRKGELALQENQIRLANAMNLARIVNWEFDVRTRLFSFDDRFYSLYATSAEREGGNLMPADVYIRDFVHPEDAPHVAKVIGDVPAITDPAFSIQLEHRIVRRDGQVRNIVVRFGIIMDTTGRVARTYGANQDITDWKQAEQDLQNSLTLLNNIIDQSPVSLWISDEKGTLIRINRACCDVLDITPEEVIGKYNVFNDNIVEEQGFLPAVRNVFDRGEIAHFELPYDTGLLRGLALRNQSTALLDVTIFPIKDGSAKVTNAVVQHLDITHRRKMEEELRITREKYTKAFLAIPDAITISELESSRIVEVNDAALALFGYTRDEFIGKSAIALGIWPRQEDRIAIVDQLKKEGRIFQVRVEERRKSGEVFDASITADTITIGDRRYVISATRDITLRKQMEKALQESEARYKNIVEDQTEFISRFRPDGTHVFVNGAYARYFGKTREELIGHPFIPDIPGEDRQVVKKHFRSLTPDNPVGMVDHRIVMPDGTVRWQRWSDRAIFDDTGRIVEYQSVGRDITETKQIEQELRNSEHLRQDIIDHLPDPTVVINADGVVIAWNKALEELTGVPAGDMLGKGNYEYAVPFYGTRQPILLDLALHDDDEVLKNYMGVKREGANLIAETTRARPRGRDVVIWASASPVYDEGGRLIGAIETIRDITERKRMEEHLRESEERYSSLFDNNYSISLLIDPETGKIVDANAAAVRYYGYPYDGLISRGIYDLNRLDRDKVVRDLLAARYRNAKHFYSTHYLASGEKRNVEVYSGPITVHGKSLFYSIIHDVTDQKLAEKALLQANRQLGLLTSITRHDILNKVTVILGYLALIEKNPADPAAGAYVKKIELSTRDIQAQIEFTRVYQDIGTTEPVWLETDRLMPVSQVPPSIVFSSRLNGISVYADPMISRVFYNLMDNSVRHGQHVTTVSVSHRESDEGLTIIFEDDGIGIPADEKEKIFMRGYGKNMGLGLFLAHEILAITGIIIRETGDPGRGARFEIVVPKGGYQIS